MKNVSIIILSSLFFIHFLSAQNKDRPFEHYKGDVIVGFGVNAIYDSGFRGKDAFDFSEQWNFATPFFLSGEYHFNRTYSIGAIVSLNKFKAGKIVDGAVIDKNNETSYIAFDVAGKYSFRKLLKTNAIEPYLFLGTGISHTGEYKVEDTSVPVFPSNSRVTINTGLGGNYWFSQYWGVNVNLAAKFEIGTSISDLFQGNLGILYQLN